MKLGELWTVDCLVHQRKESAIRNIGHDMQLAENMNFLDVFVWLSNHCA